MCNCDPPCNPIWAPDCEEHPRNAAAIRTAILLGAEFVQDPQGRWTTKGIGGLSINKTMPAWLFLCTHGLGIDKDGKPIAFSKLPPVIEHPAKS